MSSTLYVVGTPIGNLADITLRAIDTLKGVDLILAEDTRKTRILLDKYEIKKPLESYHEESDSKKLEALIDRLAAGESIAYVTDAGTPGISDPGSYLVRKAKERLGDELTVVCIPGPSALTAAISVSGVDCTQFVFRGFLPHKKGRQTALKEIALSDMSNIFYESTHRVEKFLTEADAMWGESKKVTIVKELTKIHEEILVGTAKELLAILATHPEKTKGEFVVIVEPVKPKK